MKAKICIIALFQIMMIVVAFAIIAASEDATPNPPLEINGTNGTCGLDIVLTLDSSDSLSSSELQEVKNAANAFVTSLADTSSNFSVIDFDTQIISSLPFTSDISAVTAAINSIGHSSSTELTNWHAAFTQAHINILSGDDPDHTNLVIIITDGDPTTYGYPTSLGSYGGVEPDAPDMDNAILAANALKENGTRILAVGVTSSPTLENLIDISGPNVDTGDLTTDVITTNISDLADALADFSQLCCGQTDLSITKSDSADLVYPGESLTYTIEVTNHGGHAAYDISVVDELPAEVIFDDANPAPIPSSTYTWNIPSVLVGETVSIIVNVTISDSANPGIITNTVNVYNNTYDPLLENNMDSEDTTIGNASDLRIVKYDNVADFVYPGDSFIYTLHVTNLGPREATNVVVTDTLPSGVTFDHSIPIPTPSSPNGSTYWWTLPDMAVGGSTDVYVFVNVDNIVDTVLTNVAEVVSDVHDTNLSNNNDGEETTVASAVDLIITKSDSVDPVLRGDTLTYTINVLNNGPSEANNVIVTDKLPPDVTFVSAAVSTTSVESGSSGSIYWWNFASLAAGADIDIFIDVVVNEGATDVLSNVANVTCDAYEFTFGDNIAVENTRISSAADLRVTKTGSPNPAYPRDTLTYTIELENLGPSTAENITLTDTLPDGMTFVDSSINESKITGSTYWWEFPELAAGESIILEIDVTIDDDTVGLISNHVAADSEIHDPNWGNNEYYEYITINSATDLSIEKTGSIDLIHPGESMIYTITVTNNGPSAAENIIVTDTLPVGVTFDNSSIYPNETIDNSTYRWSLDGSLASGESTIIEVEVVIDSETRGTIYNSVECMMSGVHELDWGNNDYTESTLVLSTADLGIVKSDNVNSLFPGETLAYTLNVTNHGPDLAENVNVSDILPSEVTFVSASPTENGNNGSTYWWEFVSIAVGESEIIEVEVTINNGVSGTITNFASVISDIDDLVLENNEDSEDTTVKTKTTPTGGGSGDGESSKKPTAVAGGPYPGTTREEVEFDGSESHDNDEGGVEIVQFDWKFFDGDEWHLDLGPTPTHQYTEIGLYLVSLRVTDDESVTDINTTFADIAQLNNQPTDPEITGPKNGSQNTSYTYSFVSTDADGDNISYTVEWGDGTGDVSEFLSSGVAYETDHVWSSAGIYTISAVASDNLSTSGTSEKVVLIDVIWVQDIGHLIDNDSDGTYDDFNSNSTGKIKPAEKQDDGKYLIDDDEDDDWDWVYDIETDELKPYEEPEESNYLWLFILLLLIILAILLIWYMRKKRKEEEGNQPPKKK